MYSIAMNERRDAQGPPRIAAAGRGPARPGARLRHRRNTAHTQRRDVRSPRRHAVSGAAPARARRTARQPMVRGERPPAPHLPAHGQGAALARHPSRGMAGLFTRGTGGGRRARMTPGPLDSYLEELRQALGARGHDDPRIVDEAREHLADAVEAGMRRGLDRTEAEREAIERFGPPDVVAVHTPPRSRIMARLTTALGTIVGHWRWITAATAGAALVTSVASHYLLPTRYRSEMVIAITQRTLSPEQNHTSEWHLNLISRAILSTSRLDSIARNFGLDKRADSPGDAVLQMRRSLGVALMSAGQE